MTEREKILPNAVEAEEALIGSLMIAPDMLRDIRPLISADQFYIQRYGWAYNAVLALVDRGVSVDAITIERELAALNKLDEFGGRTEILRLIGGVSSIFSAPDYAKIINETYVRRRALEGANYLAKLAYDESIQIDEIQAKAGRIPQWVFDELAIDNYGVLASEAMSRQFDRMEEISKGTNPAIPTGLIDLDGILSGGPRGGDLVIVAGRPGMGKTAIMLDMFLHDCKTQSDKWDIFFSLEMPTEQLSDRLICKYEIDSSRIRKGILDDLEYPIYTNALEHLQKMNFIIDDTPGLKPDQLRSKLAKIATKHPINQVFVDYIQLMEAGIRSDNRVAEITYISRQLKLIAREFGVPVIAGAQLSREVEKRADKKPILSDLRESGSLEQDSDIVIFLFRPELYFDDPAKQNIAEAIVAKHRNGPTGTVSLIFRKNYMKFENAVARTVDLNGYRDFAK